MTQLIIKKRGKGFRHLPFSNLFTVIGDQSTLKKPTPALGECASRKTWQLQVSTLIMLASKWGFKNTS